MNHSFLYGRRILLVDDEPELLQMVASILKGEGFTDIVCASDAQTAMKAVKEAHPDLALLDVMLPDRDGFSLLTQIRSQKDIPVIFLTAKDEAQDKLTGLGLGADDYITKPFLPQELLLRVCAVLRRCCPEEDPVIRLEDCVIDFSRAAVIRKEATVFLTAMEVRLLETLARNAGKIVTMDALCEALWGDNPYGYENSLNVHVRRIRQKIERVPSRPASLLTAKGLGYRLMILP